MSEKQITSNAILKELLNINSVHQIQTLDLPLNPRVKQTRLNQNIIQQLLLYCKRALDIDPDTGAPMRRRCATGGRYYRMIVDYADACFARGLEKVDGLPCYYCRERIKDNEECISMAKGNGKKYYHLVCAERVNIL